MNNSTETEFVLRLSTDLHEQLVKLAQAEHRSLQSLLVTILAEAVNKQNTTQRQDVMDDWDDRDRLPS